MVFLPRIGMHSFPVRLNVFNPLTNFYGLSMVEGPLLGGGLRTNQADKWGGIGDAVLHYLKSHYSNVSASLESNISYVISDSNDILIEKIVESFRNIGQKNIAREMKRANDTFNQQKSAGLYLPAVESAFISRENIGDICKTPKYFDSTLILTIIHETLHSLGSLPDKYKSFSLNWLEEGFCELLALEMHKSLYQKEYGIPAETYQYSYRAVKSITGTEPLGFAIPMATLLECFVKRSVEPLVAVLQSKGLTDSQIDRLFELGQRIDEKDKKAEGYSQFIRYLEGIKQRVSEPQGGRKPKDWQPPPGYGGQITEEVYRSSIESLREDAARKLSALDLHNARSLNEAEAALFRFMAVFYRDSLGKIQSPIPSVYYLPSDVCDKYQKSLNGFYSVTYDSVGFTFNADKLEKHQKIYLMCHENAHALFWANKPAALIGQGFENTFSEAITNVVASEVFSVLFPRLKDKKADALFQNRRMLSDRVLQSLGRETTYRWYFSPDAMSIRDILTGRYGFGADRLLDAAAKYADAPQTFLSVAMGTLERSKETDLPRIVIPTSSFDANGFSIGWGYGAPKDQLRVIYGALQNASPGISPYDNFVTAAALLYSSQGSQTQGQILSDSIQYVVGERLKGNDPSFSIAEGALEAVDRSFNIHPEIKTGSHVLNAALDLIYKGETPTDSRIVETLANVSEMLSSANSVDYSADGLEALRNDLMQAGWNAATFSVKPLDSVQINPLSPFSSGLSGFEPGNALVLDPSGKISETPAENPFIEAMLSSGQQPVIYQPSDNGIVVVPAPPTFTADDISKIPSTLESIASYANAEGFKHEVSQNDANMIRMTYDLFGSIYSSVQLSVWNDIGTDAAFAAQKLFVAPDMASIKMIYDIAVLSSECVPLRSYTFDAAF